MTSLLSPLMTVFSWIMSMMSNFADGFCVLNVKRPCKLDVIGAVCRRVKVVVAVGRL